MEQYYRDHLGNDYSSLEDMCKTYNITVEEFKHRRTLGLNVEDCLTMTDKKVALYERYKQIKAISKFEDICTDHLGNEYLSLDDMCKTYHTTAEEVERKINNGVDLKTALTGEGGSQDVACKDHLGNEYPSVEIMCEIYGVPMKEYYNRLSLGVSLEDILTKKPIYDKFARQQERIEKLRHSKKDLKRKNHMGDRYEDYLGNFYSSKIAMCEAHGVTIQAYNKRIAEGMSVEEALTTPVGNWIVCTDHLGNIYPSREAMCRAYNIDTSLYWSRLSRGIGLEEALTTPSGKLNETCCYDHLGNKYSSREAMCRAYNKSATLVFNRVAKGMSLKDALTIPTESKMGVPCKDHLGKGYQSQKAMCKAYNISVQTFVDRIKSGMSIEESLTIPVGELHAYACEDHLGNKFKSKGAMFSAYNVDKNITENRLKRGMSLEKALTTPAVEITSSPCKDHLGNEYPSKEAMCRAYNISSSTFKCRIKRGMDLESALTSRVEELKGVACQDHLGNIYPSREAMCRAYNIDISTLLSRLAAGTTLEKALTTPAGSLFGKACQDHLGNEYLSKTAMCKAYDIDVNTYNHRIKKGMSVEEALTTKVNKTLRKDTKQGSKEKRVNRGGTPCTDHLGNEYPSKRAMCEAYNIDAKLVSNRLRRHMSLEEALTTPADTKSGKPCKDHLGNEYPTKEAVCKVYGVDSSTLYLRLRDGMSLEEALTTPAGDLRGKTCKDHLGNEYPSKVAMCRAYGVTITTFMGRVKKGMSLEDALTKPTKKL